jgi:hypothetical protein
MHWQSADLPRPGHDGSSAWRRLRPLMYVEGRRGFALGDMSRGELWIGNDNGVCLHLKARRDGLALSLGGDTNYIDMD